MAVSCVSAGDFVKTQYVTLFCVNFGRMIIDMPAIFFTESEIACSVVQALMESNPRPQGGAQNLL